MRFQGFEIGYQPPHSSEIELPVDDVPVDEDLGLSKGEPGLDTRVRVSIIWIIGVILVEVLSGEAPLDSKLRDSMSWILVVG